MPTVLIGTLTEDGKTSLGPYSLVQPYYVAGKDYYAMLLCARNNSNTAQHLLARGKCSINFITDEKKNGSKKPSSYPGQAIHPKKKNEKLPVHA